MKAIKIRGKIIGAGIDYKKFVRGIPEADKKLIKQNHSLETFFFIKVPKGGKKHYKQSGYKVVTYNHDRYEFYHREPSMRQWLCILKKEGHKI